LNSLTQRNLAQLLHILPEEELSQHLAPGAKRLLRQQEVPQRTFPRRSSAARFAAAATRLFAA